MGYPTGQERVLDRGVQILSSFMILFHVVIYDADNKPALIPLREREYVDQKQCQ
jgi:hypothetical protein